jgi:hypothetical protein
MPPTGPAPPPAPSGPSKPPASVRKNRFACGAGRPANAPRERVRGKGVHLRLGVARIGPRSAGLRPARFLSIARDRSRVPRRQAVTFF